MKEDIKLYSPLDPIALALKLKAEMKKRRRRKGYHVFGGGTEHDMKLTYRRHGLKIGAAPYLTAEMSAHEGGTLIEGEIKQNEHPIPFFLMWNGFVGLFFVFSLFLWTVDDAPWIFNLIFSGIPGVMLIIGLTAWYKTSKEEPEDPGTPQHILDFLADIVDARPL